MGLLGGESWCFCSGGGKSERLKATLYATKSAAMATLSSSTKDGGGGEVTGCGFLIHKNLLLTTHVNLPSASAADSSDLRLQNGAVATLVPHRFFITSSVLDLTIVGLDSVEGDSNPSGSHLKTCSKPNLDLGSAVYVLGYAAGGKELTISEGKVVIATDNLIKFSTEGVTWSPGSAGFDANGNLAFMICDPMKLATSPYTKASASSTTSSTSSSCKRDRETLFGIPMPVICGWLNQHWEGGLDELSKPKLPLMRLVSAGRSWSEHHGGSSVITNEIFKATEAEELAIGPQDASGTNDHEDDDEPAATAQCTNIQAPERNESPKVASVSIGMKEEVETSDSESNIEPRVDEDSIPAEPCMDQLPGTDILILEGSGNAEDSSSGSANAVQHEVESSPSRVEGKAGMGSMYSAETAESSNTTSPREARFRKSEGRGQGGVTYNRWAAHKYPVARKSSVEKPSSITQPRKSISQGATSQMSHGLSSPTVSSIMKKRNADLEKPKPASKTRQTAVSSTPRLNHTQLKIKREAFRFLQGSEWKLPWCVVGEAEGLY